MAVRALFDSSVLVGGLVEEHEARALIEHHLYSEYEIVELNQEDYTIVLQKLPALGLSGAVVYDALIGRAAEKTGANLLLTLNRRDFDRLQLDLEVREP